MVADRCDGRGPRDRFVGTCWSLPWLVAEHRDGGPAASYLAGTVNEVIGDGPNVEPSLALPGQQ